MSNHAKTVVLAYSGGLDTSYCVKYLSEVQQLDVHAVMVNTGGFSTEEIKETEARARTLGVKEFHCADVTDAYYQDCLRFLVFGNVLRYQTYPLSVSAERVFQAKAIAEYAAQIGADYVAHGSTGAGNDQVRFDLMFEILCPGITILTPIRDQQLSREAEIAFLKEHGVEMPWEKAKYSINQGLWGTSVGGAETLTSHQMLPEEAWPTPLSKEQPESVSLDFIAGELKGVNGVSYDNPVDAIRALHAIAAPFAIGRDVHVGDTIIGIKGRVGFEAAAPLIIIKAHHALEKHVLTKWQHYWKDQLANWYGMMVHEGQLLDPVMRDIEAFLAQTQHNVSGTVHVQLSPYQFMVQGIESPYDLMSSAFGSYGEMNQGWTGEDVKGFTKILSNQTKIHYHVNKKG